MPDHSFGFQIVPPSRHFNFGPFEVDSRAGELRKHGIKLRIGQQSLQVLLMLLEHPGEVVLREDIRLKLWPNDTVVEFDHSINAVIQKLRAALGESAGSPVYIETLARRGYRFIGTVNAASPNGDGVPPLPAETEPAVAAAVAPVEAPGRRPRALFWAGVAVLLAVVALALLRPWTPRRPVWTFSLGTLRQAAVSPDGSALVYVSSKGLKLRRMSSMEETTVYSARPISDIPVWSPDGSQVLLAANGVLVRLPVPNGPPVTIAPLVKPPRGIAWSSNGTILIAMFDGSETGNLFMVPAAGGEPVRLAMPGLTGGMFFLPEFLPDGENLIFAWAALGDGEAGLYLATLRAGRIVRGPTLLRKNMTAGHYSPFDGGRLLYVHDDVLFAQKLKLQQGMLQGTPERIVGHVFSAPTFRNPSVSVSRNGVLIWRSGRAGFAEMTWFDRSGKVLGTAGPACLPWHVRLSPDEKHILFQAIGGFGIADANRGGFLPLPGLTNPPLWIPGNSHIVSSRQEANGPRFVERAVEGGPATDLAPVGGPPLDVSPDGQVLLYHSGAKLFSIRLGGAKASAEVLADSTNARFSPDGHWIVYGGSEIYVQPFPSGGLPTQISLGPGSFPVWRADGKEILYLAGSTIYSVRVHVSGKEFHADRPAALFDVLKPSGLTGDSSPLAVTRDGSRILFAQGVEPEDSQPTNVMTDFTAVLRK